MFERRRYPHPYPSTFSSAIPRIRGRTNEIRAGNLPENARYPRGRGPGAQPARPRIRTYCLRTKGGKDGM
eukprot:9106423-Pyramimonas_sp.AAC.1